MSGNSIGKSFVVTTFGESHGQAMGCVIDGCPPGIEIDESIIQIDPVSYTHLTLPTNREV